MELKGWEYSKRAGRVFSVVVHGDAARSLVRAVKIMRRGELKQPDGALRDLRQK